MRHDRHVAKLNEKPVHRVLRRLVGSRWVHGSFMTKAELSFDPQGRITGTHRSGLGGQVQDAGHVESYSINAGRLIVKFTAVASMAFCPGSTKIRIVDDGHIAFLGTTGGKTERYVFVRTVPARK